MKIPYIPVLLSLFNIYFFTFIVDTIADFPTLFLFPPSPFLPLSSWYHHTVVCDQCLFLPVKKYFLDTSAANFSYVSLARIESHDPPQDNHDRFKLIEIT